MDAIRKRLGGEITRKLSGETRRGRRNEGWSMEVRKKGKEKKRKETYGVLEEKDTVGVGPELEDGIAGAR